jgi:hypothetical protein
MSNMTKTPKSDQQRALREAKFERDQAHRRRVADTIIITPPQPHSGEISLEPHFIGSAIFSEDGVHIFEIEDPKPLQMKRRGRPRQSEEGFDKSTYQRDYMRKRRAEKKAPPA